MSIKVLLWDIDGTILNFEMAEAAAVRKGFANHHLGECTDAMLADYSAINQRYWQILERGEMSKPEILVSRFREFFTKYGIDPALAETFNRQYQIDLGDTVCFNDEADVLVAEWKGTYRQYAVTNGTVTAQRRKLSRSGLDQVLDGVFISDEVGAEKPSKAYFDHVLAQIEKDAGKIDRREMLLIGDSLTSDIRGAVDAGIPCCWYNPAGKKNPDGPRPNEEITDLHELKALLARLSCC